MWSELTPHAFAYSMPSTTTSVWFNTTKGTQQPGRTNQFNAHQNAQKMVQQIKNTTTFHPVKPPNVLMNNHRITILLNMHRNIDASPCNTFRRTKHSSGPPVSWSALLHHRSDTWCSKAYTNINMHIACRKIVLSVLSKPLGNCKCF